MARRPPEIGPSFSGGGNSAGQAAVWPARGGALVTLLHRRVRRSRCGTEWLDDVVRRDDDGFILTGSAAGAHTLLETSLPGVFAVGDVRSGSTKRCATAVGEGAWAVQLVHAHLGGG